MLKAAKERFECAERAGYVSIQEWDLRKSFPMMTTSVVLSILTLQFVPINYRQGIVQAAYDHMAPGGAFILVEKVLGNSTALDNLQVDLYHKMKGERGYSGEEIERKKTALEGVLVPIKASWNEELLRNAGFRQVDCFWRWMNFAGWVAVK
jgi:tRNA (cmo5U34)-methyltransferase